MSRPAAEKLRVLYVSYPLLTVSDESAGGAEQMLATLEAEMARRGFHTIVAASNGSQVSGELLPTGSPALQNDRLAEREQEHSARIFDYLRTHPVDFIHDHSGSFWRRAAEVKLPVLATLHLPRSMYAAGAFTSLPRNLFFNCVSQSQRKAFSGLRQLIGAVTNGVNLDRFPLLHDKGDYLLYMGRICEEKGPHVAVEVARRTGLPLVLAGQVYPFSCHEQYYARAIRPALNGRVRFVETPLFATKVRLLAGARCVLVPSLVEETSSLAAIEAMACGTPVVAFRRGGIPEVVADCETGFVVNDVDEMVRAITRVPAISPKKCREYAEQHFSAARLAADYERLYRRLLGKGAPSETARRSEIGTRKTGNRK